MFSALQPPSTKVSNNCGHRQAIETVRYLERARRFERPTPTLARLCSTPELRPLNKPVNNEVIWTSGMLYGARAFRLQHVFLPMQQQTDSRSARVLLPYSPRPLIHTENFSIMTAIQNPNGKRTGSWWAIYYCILMHQPVSGFAHIWS